MHRSISFWVRVLYLSLCLVFGCVVSLSRAECQVNPDIMLADERLNRLVSLKETGISLQTLLQQVSSKQLVLEAGPSCRDLKIQLRIKKRPLRDLLFALSELLPGNWTPLNDQNGYSLHMTRKAQEERQEWWELFLSERQKTLQVIRSKIEQQMQTPPQSKPLPDSISATEKLPVDVQQQLTQEFFYHLSDRLKERIASHCLPNSFYRKSMNQSNFSQESSFAVSWRELPPLLQTRLEQRMPMLLAEGSRIRFFNHGLGVVANLEKPAERWSGTLGSLAVHPFPDAICLSLDHSSLERYASMTGRKISSNLERLIAFHKKRVWKNQLPNVLPAPPPLPHRSDWLTWLGKTTDIEFVTDYYSDNTVPLRRSAKAGELRRSLAEELNEQAANLDFSWKKSTSEIYLVRNNRWYRDDALEVPSRVLNPLLEQLAQMNKALEATEKQDGVDVGLQAQIDFAAEIVQQLTPWQIANGLTYYVQEQGNKFDPDQPGQVWRPFANIAERTLNEYNTILFYAGLNGQQRKVLWDNALPLHSLTPKQQAEVVRICSDIAEAKNGGEGIYLGLQPYRPMYQVKIAYTGSQNAKIPPQIRLYGVERR
jgi:hypothetical protein